MHLVFCSFISFNELRDTEKEKNRPGEDKHLPPHPLHPFFGDWKKKSLFWNNLFVYLPCIGCGRYAGGQGYNSIGHFCGGWAGNCGDGGIGGSTWYLVCDRCREKYLREKQAAAREKVLYICFCYV